MYNREYDYTNKYDRNYMFGFNGSFLCLPSQYVCIYTVIYWW